MVVAVEAVDRIGSVRIGPDGDGGGQVQPEEPGGEADFAGG